MPAVLEEVESPEIEAAYRFARSGPEECYGIIVMNDPVNWIDPDGNNRIVVELFKRYGPRLVGPARRFVRDINVDGPLGTRVCQIRYKRKPVLRLDYGPYEGTHGEPRLHGHIPGKWPDLHIPLDPRSLFE